jgi:glycosyltransferase involved in cell wall biosynthesis
MKKILIFSLNYYPRFIGGAEVAIKEITDRIDPSEIEFHMVTLRIDSTLPKEEKVGNVIVHRIGASRPNPGIADLKRYPLHGLKHWYQLFAVFAALRLHKKYAFDGVWAMMAHSTGIPAALFKTFHPEVPYLLTLQEGDPPEYIEKLARPVWPLFKRSFTKADYLQPISTFLLSWGHRMGFKGHAEVIPNAVDTEHFGQEYSDSVIEEAQRSLGKKDGDVFLVTTSRLVHKNAVDGVIRALTFLPSHVHFLIYGIGPDEVVLKAIAKDLGVESRTHFMGQITHADLPLALKACDIFIRPSRSEGMGNSFVEAMAAGLPVVATQEGGISDFLFDEKRNPEKETTGWAVAKDSPKEIAAAIEDILVHPDKVEMVVKTAHSLVAEKYDWNIVAGRMHNLFDRMLQKR